VSVALLPRALVWFVLHRGPLRWPAQLSERHEKVVMRPLSYAVFGDCASVRRAAIAPSAH
jgi:hypothetical protein